MYFRNSLLLLLVFLSLSACKDKERENVLRLVQEWEGKEIKFPIHSVFTIQGRDTVDFDYQDADYKIVTYVDSIGCTSCKFQLHRWKELIMESDSITNRKISFLFFSHLKDIKELCYLTQRDTFTYPICFDEKDEFNALNRFPSDMTFQTFLLDRDNKVMVIGNPVFDPQIKELYLNKLTGKENKVETSTTRVGIPESEFDFGTFLQTEKQEHIFRLKNEGEKQLVIYDVITSCGCTKVEYSKQPVHSGESLELNVFYEAEEAGHFMKTVTVHCNTKDSPIRLRIKGVVK